ncbi:caffeic acid 3-O-methyltransferase-like [Phalaenopsis equestris]|uniref:caffeic acid 3-O-methyltransferase-like n=1 Tax=Phalaenopsis equestris TaxID=78828 RepID=UPI0009E503E2|nr:caffeic acid 3-O-methyltransferase-like [Phalaenopsis equestris]
MEPSTPAQLQDDEAAYLATLQLLSYHGVAMAVKAAIELDIFNILARSGPDTFLSAGEIACQISNSDPSKTAPRLDRVLRFLASHSVLRFSSACSASSTGAIERRYALEPIYRFLAKNKDGVSLAPAFLVTRDQASLGSWQYLKDAVLEDIDPFTKANGSDPFEYMATKDRRFGELFCEYMASVTKLTSGNIVEAYKGFEFLSEVVDVGGGEGTMLGLIISRYPHIKGINFDLPHVISSAPNIPGVEYVAGDFLSSIPSGDALLLKFVLHDWSDEDCIRILKNCYKALPITGKVIVVEQILPEIPERNNAVRDVYFMDLSMMVTNHRAKERSEKEFISLASEAGFAEFKIACCVMNYHVMEFIK